MKRMTDGESVIPQNKRSRFPKRALRASVWVIIGYIFWLGFFIGAVIMHAMVK
jgi:hypothetical protein